MASAADENRAPTFSTDETPKSTTPLLTREVIEEETHTVKRTITTEYAQTASPETPTRQRANRGFSSPFSTPKYHGQHTAPVLTTPIKSEKFHATPENEGKYSRTPLSVGTQHTPFSTPQTNRFTQAPFTQANRVVTPPMPPLTQPRRMPTPRMPSSTQPRTPQTPIRQFPKYYPISHPTELEPFMSKYFYVVTVGQDVGIFATWYANSFSFVSLLTAQGMRQIPASQVSLGVLTPNARTGMKPFKFIPRPTPKVAFEGSQLPGGFLTTRSF